ncbi:sys1 [Scenedesmus sp. PABB004]|nr:sys1 [Scenedesmus sp. PABB004]
MFYGSNVWDPVLITAQIVAVQCLFYVSLGLLQAVMLGPTLGYITVDFLFDWGHVHFATRLGWLNWLAHVLNAVAAAAVLAWIVERAKKCLDFAATAYIWHTLFVWGYSGKWPASAAWWSATGLGFVIMVLLGEWLCVRRELQDIPLSLHTWGSRKVSGIVQPVPTDDPDLLPPKPRLRATSTMQRPAAAAASSAGAPPAALPPAPGGGTRAPDGRTVLQMAALGGSSARKKILSRPSSSSSLGQPGQRPAAAADGDPT